MKTSAGPSLEQYDNSVQALRTQINIVDDQIVTLLKTRLELVNQAREIKHIDQMPQHNLEREQVILENVTAETQGLEKKYLLEIYQALLSVTRRIADQFEAQ